MYLILAIIFFLTLIVGFFITLGFIFNLKKCQSWKKFAKSYLVWLVFYGIFIALGTGPNSQRLYVSPEMSPYKLPWANGVSRFVSQGNRSFTSHRDHILFAWDFWMPIGTEVLAARSGIVRTIEQSFEGIGLNSNFIVIEHEDGTRAMYAHIKKNGAAVNIGDEIKQGQLIAYSGMVGQTINPHLHFVVFNKEETDSLPITFSDVADGVPLAGHFYTSKNAVH